MIKHFFIIAMQCCMVMALSAQEFYVQLGAFEVPVKDNYFSNTGLKKIKIFQDRFNIFHYYVDGFTNVSDAERFQARLKEQGYQHVQIIDVEVQEALCADYCNGLGRTIFELENLELSPIFFDFNSSTIQEEYKVILDQISIVLDRHPELKTLLEGHTDARGNPTYNRQLAIDRVRAVRSYLRKKGIPYAQVQMSVFGEAEPLAINIKNGADSPEGRRLNRRVTLIILGPNGQPVYNVVKKMAIPYALRINEENVLPETILAQDQTTSE